MERTYRDLEAAGCALGLAALGVLWGVAMVASWVIRSCLTRW